MLQPGGDAGSEYSTIDNARSMVLKAVLRAFLIVAFVTNTLRYKRAMFALALLFIPLGVLVMGATQDVDAQSSTLNFQGRLLTNTGSLVADGDYNIEFKIYDSAAAGASAQGVCVGGGTDDCLWVETRTGGNQVSIQNGYYSVYLGDITSLPDIDWSQDLWVTMNIGGTGAPSWDGEMSPRFRLTSVPRALSAEELSVTDSGNTTTIQIATPTSDNTITAPDDSGTLCLTSGNCAGVGGTGDILDGGQTGAISVGTTNNTTLTLLQNGSAAITLNSSQLLQFNAYNCSTFTNGGTLTTDASGNVVCANDDGGAGASTLQASYDADTNGSDVRIDLTTADDSLIFSNPSSGGSNSEFVLTVEQLATGASTSGLQIISNGTSGSYALRVNDDGTDSDSTPFVVENTGDVGIGTASPSRPLDVQRDATDTDGGAIARFEGDLTYEAASSTENQYGVRAAITLDLDSAAASGSTYYGIGSNLTVVDGNLSNGTAVATNSFASKSSGGTLGNAVGGRFYVFNQSTGTIQNAYGLSVVDALNSSGTIQDQAGIAIANQTGTGDRTNLLIGTINIPDGADYSIYNASGYQNYFASGLRFGADSTDNLIDNLSNGSGSATLYIGNQAIVVNSDIAGFDTTDDTVSGTVDTSEIQNDTITEPDLDLTNTPTDNYILTYNSGGANFTWVDPTTVGTTPTLQVAYDNGNTLTTSNNRDLTVTLANTATDSDFVINVASGSTSEFAVQNNGTNQLVINSGGIDLLDVDTADFTGATVTFDAGEIDEAEIAQNSLDDSEIQNNSLTSLSLANDSVQSAEIDDNTIQEVDLEATNSATDDYVLTYDSGSGGFTWVSQAAVSGTAGVTSLNTLDGDLSIVGNTQIGVSPSGSNINLSVQADSIGDAQLEYNTGQNLTTTSNVTFGGLTITSGSSYTFGTWSASDTDIDGLLTGTSSGGLLEAPTNAHYVLGLRENGANDAFAVISGGGNWSSDSTYDTLALEVRASGDTSVAGDLTVTGANLILGSTDLSEADLDALDNGTITLGTETTGAYDSTPDTIADDGVISDGEVNNNITVSGGTIGSNNISGTLTTTGALTIGDGGDAISINSNDWDISTTGVITGASLSSTQLTDGGTISFDWTNAEVADNLTISSSGNVNWAALSSYPAACGAGTAITALADSPTCTAFATSDTTYTAGNDLDLSVTTFNIESQLDFVSVINRTSSDLTLQTTTSGNILLSPAAATGVVQLDSGNLRVGTGSTPGLTLNGDDLFVEGTAEIDGQLRVDAQINANGVSNLNGDVNLGNAAADTITFNGEVDSSIIPDTDDAYDLGSSTNRWRDLYLGPASLNIGTNANNGVLSYNTTNSALQINRELRPTSSSAFNLGADTLRWDQVYSGSLNIGESGNEFTIGYDDSTGIARISLSNGIGFNSANSYINFNSTDGSSGYGIRDNGGTIEVKNSGGGWAAIGAGAWTSSGGYTTLNTPADNVGIGISTPDEKLYVQGSSFTYAKVESTTANSAGIKFENTVREWSVSNNTSTGDFTVNDITGGRTPLTIQDGALSNSIYVNSSSNVGIRTNSPTVTFEVLGPDGGAQGAPAVGGDDIGMFRNNGVAADNANVSVISGTTGSAQFGLGDSGNRFAGALLYNNNTNQLQVNTNGSGRLFIDSVGDVGIGRAPGSFGGAKLEVYGTEGSVTAGPNIQAVTSEDNYPLFQQLNWRHDNIALSFDTYYDGSSWRSSDAGSNFQIYKQNDGLRLKYESGVAQGGAATFTDGLVLNSSGTVITGVQQVTNEVQFTSAGSQTDPTIAFGTGTGNNIGIYSNTTSNILFTIDDLQRLNLTATELQFDGFLDIDTGGSTLAGAVSVGGDLTVSGGSGITLNGVTTRLRASGTTTAEYLEVGHGGSNAYIDNVGDGDIDFRHEGTDVLSITAGRNATFGGSGQILTTSNGNLTLDTNGTGDLILQTSNQTALTIEGNDSGNLRGALLLPGATSGTSAGEGNIYFRNTNTTNRGARIHYLDGSADGTGNNNNLFIDSVGDDNSDGIVFRTGNDTTPSEGFRINSNNSVVVGAWVYYNGRLYNDNQTAVNTNNFSACVDIEGSYDWIGRCSSTRDKKKNITNIDLGLDTVRQLTPRSFEWIDGGLADVGFIADEVAAVDPRLAEFNSDGTLSGVHYMHFSALTTRAIQELDLQVQSNLSQIDSVKNRLSVLESTTNSLTKKNITVTNQTTTAKLSVTGTATIDNLEVTGFTEVADLKVNGKIITAGDTPTAVLGATTTGQGSSYTIEGNDTAGTIEFETGTDTVSNPVAAGEQIVVTFDEAYDQAPRVTLTPLDAASATIDYFVTRDQDGFTLHFVDAPSENETYSFDYQILQ